MVSSVSWDAHGSKAFTGKPPFHKISSTAAAVSVLSGERPTRPARPDLTNDLWEITERCWHWNAQCRPDITEVVHCLQNSIDLRDDRIDVDDDRATDNASSESVPQEGALIREYSATSENSILSSC